MTDGTFKTIDWKNLGQQAFDDLIAGRDVRDGAKMTWTQKDKAKQIRQGVVFSDYDPLKDFEPYPKSSENMTDSEWKQWSKSFGRSFNQFWGECLKYVGSTPTTVLERPGAEALVKNRAAYLKSLQDVAEEVFAEKVREGVHLKDLQKANNFTNTQDRKRVMQTLLQIGYEKFEGQHVVGWELIEAETFDLGLFSSTKKPKFVFRCDGRDPKTIEDNEGTKCRADIDSKAEEAGYDEDWHPFKDRDARKEMWFRRGNSDNDLNTIISLSPELEAAAGFPVLDNARLAKHPSDKDFQTNDAFDEVKWKQYFDTAKVKYKDEVPNLDVAVLTYPNKEKRRLYTVRSFVYVILLDERNVFGATKKLQTYHGQDEFPELGVRGVRWTNHIALIPVRKLYVSKTKAEGYYLFFEETKVLQSYYILVPLLGIWATQWQVKQRIDQIRAKVPREQANAPASFLQGATIAWPTNWPVL